ncbi:MAG: peptidylprolyl isomerase [Planctomycetia bacterium]|jgi:parvulin-like peptidyl-prolyl isomerase
MNQPGLRPRESTSLRSAAAIAFCAVLAALNGLRDAHAQGAVAPASTAIRNLVPSVPEAVSRPEGWPGAKPTKGNNHVLSSIRDNPDAPIVPLTAADLAGRPAADGGVVQAQFVEPAAAEPAAAAAPPTGSMSESLLAKAESLDTAIVVARVGPEVVLAGDLLTPSALAWLEKVSPGLKPEQIRELKLQICRQVLSQHVESLIIYVDACRTIPEDRLPEIEKKVNEAFDQQQLPRLIKDAGVANSVEYEQLLKARGQSLDRIRKTFFERALAQQWVQQKVTSDEEIPHAEMIAWYQNHLADYDFPAKAKFEQLTARITPTQTRDQAWNKLAAMGNDVLEGKPFEEIARTRSEGPTAASGGAYDWTTKGSLASKVLDEAIFRLPLGQLSTILEDGSALHIVRVTERTEAGRTPFVEAQVGIRQELMDERRKREMDDYLAKLKERTPVWTLFDGEPPMATAGGGRGTVAR